jgi:hypothetical protein
MSQNTLPKPCFQKLVAFEYFFPAACGKWATKWLKCDRPIILSSILPFALHLAYLPARQAYLIAITIDGSNIASARIGKKEKPGWKAGFFAGAQGPGSWSSQLFNISRQSAPGEAAGRTCS